MTDIWDKLPAPRVTRVCVWCGHQLYDDPPRICSAPDGDGHLYQVAYTLDADQMQRIKNLVKKVKTCD